MLALAYGTSANGLTASPGGAIEPRRGSGCAQRLKLFPQESRRAD